MAMAMAVPAFADWTIEVDDNSNRYINVYGTYGSSLNMRYLTLYKTSAPNSEQCFHLYRSSGFGDNFVLCASTNSQYAMNRNSNNGRAWLWSLSNNGYGDSRLKTPQSDSSTLWFPTAMEQLAYLALMLFLGPLAQVGLHPERQRFLWARWMWI